MPVRDPVSYNTVIAAFSNSVSSSGKALELFVRMQGDGFEPTDYTHVSALKACSKLMDLNRGKQVHGRIVAANVIGNAFVWNALLDFYAKCGLIDQARWLFDRMFSKNVVSWNSMISGYIQNGRPEKCIDLFHEMRLAGFKPDQVTLTNVLGAYSCSGNLDEACKIFHEIEEKDMVSWTNMIVGYAQNGKEEDALLLFQEMQLANIKPDSFTMSTLVNSCARLASLYHGQTIHGKAVLMGVNYDLLVSSSLVDMYCKCGETADAWAVFKTMSARNVVSWNSMIGGYTQNGQGPEALALYNEMLKEDLKPDDVTFVGILSACDHGGLVDRGWEYFDSINKIHGRTPTLDHYACMINLLGHARQMHQAIELINSLPHEPSSVIWSTFLSICAINGDIEHGEMAAKHLFELEPCSAGPYIMLSNMYAARGRWTDVASIRSLMKDRKVKKFAAYSWIEIDNKVHKFVAEDRTHPETDNIYEELQILIKRLQEAGFIPDTELVLHDVGEAEKLKSISFHSEKLALAFGLIKKPAGRTPIRIIKNLRVCGDCHNFMKFVSRIIDRPITLRDSNRYHHFVGGQCSCKDYW